MVQKSLLRVSSIWKYRVTTLLGSRHIMTSVSSRSEPVNLSNMVQSATWCSLILSLSSWRPSPLNHRNVQLLQFVFGCNLPLIVTEHPWCNALVSSLRPGYKLTTRDAICNKWLDKCHDKSQAQSSSWITRLSTCKKMAGCHLKWPSHCYISGQPR